MFLGHSRTSVVFFVLNKIILTRGNENICWHSISNSWRNEAPLKKSFSSFLCVLSSKRSKLGKIIRGCQMLNNKSHDKKNRLKQNIYLNGCSKWIFQLKSKILKWRREKVVNSVKWRSIIGSVDRKWKYVEVTWCFVELKRRFQEKHTRSVY